MPTLLDGLYLYEIVLLVLGVVLFVVLLVALLKLVFGGKPFGGLLAFFALPIVMIGYPSIKSIEIGSDTVKIEKATAALRENPTNSAAREELRSAVANFSARPITGVDRTVALAQAQFALGDERAAAANLQKAQKADPASPKVIDLKKRIDVVHELGLLTATVEARPGDAEAKAQLARTLADATAMKHANPNALTSIARAQAAVGEHARALENADKALAIDPKSAAAKDVKLRALAAVPRPH